MPRRKGVGIAFAAFDDFCRAVKAFTRQQCCQQTVVGGLARMERLGHGAAVLLQAGRLRGRDAQAVIGLAAVEPQQSRSGNAGRQRAQRAGQMPARIVMAGRGLADANSRLKAEGISHHQVRPGAGHQGGRRKERRQHGRAGVQDHAVHVRVIKVEHVTHLPVHQGRFQNAHFLRMPDHLGFGQTARSLQRRLQARNGVGVTASQRATEPVEQAALALMADTLRQLFVLKAGREVAKNAAGAQVHIGRAVR